jgi:radical SAM-linked protein
MQNVPLHRLRVVFEKLGDTRFISHLDLTNTMNRALRRALLPVAYTEGFSPRPRTAFGPPLPLFVEGARELSDFELTESVPVDEVIRRMNEVLPTGIRLLEGGYIPNKTSSITAAIRRASYRVESREGALDLAPDHLTAFLARESITITKESKGQKKTVDVRPAIVSLAVRDGGLDAVVEASPQRSLNIFDLLNALIPGTVAAESSRFRVVRTAFTLEEAPAPAVDSAGAAQ